MGLPVPEVEELFERRYPAQFICEAIDQTRGWFYTLMAVGTLVFDRSSYENVVCLGHILAEDGRKMSKHLGNILEPIPLMDQHGADAVRWFMAAVGSPWAARRVGHGALQEVVRKMLLTYWNTVAFQALYARTAGWTPATAGPGAGRPPGAGPLAALASCTGSVDEVDAARWRRSTPSAPASCCRAFVDDLSNWYVRRSRRRFWQGDPAALRTLHEMLDVLTRLMAPLTPFITERVWQDVVRCVDDAAAESVHLATWPSRRHVHDRRRAVAADGAGAPAGRAGRAARAEAGVKTRQPLPRALVARRAWDASAATSCGPRSPRS